jgi:D-sedoheptulose 7-phosphate isomerase
MVNFDGYREDLKILLDMLNLNTVEDIAKEIRRVNSRGHRIYICGNGGSASTAEHCAQDLFKSCDIYAISLTSNVSAITAYGNDDGYDKIFRNQLKFATSEDLLIVYSGSGNSKNILEALINFPGTKIGILGYDGGKAKNLCTIPLVIESFDMQYCEDMHMVVTHMLMKYLKG